MASGLRFFLPWLAALCAAGAALAQTAAERTTWFAIVADDGAPLGYASTEIVDRARGRDIVERREVYLREQGGEATRIAGRSVRSVDETGATTSISATTRMGRFQTHTEARVAAGWISAFRETPSGRVSRGIEAPAGLRFDDGEALLRDWELGETPQLAFDSFNLGEMDVERVVLQAVAPDPTQPRREVLRLRYRRGEIVGVARLALDGEGRIAEVSQPMFGAVVHVRATDRETAQRRHRTYQVVPNAMMRSPFRISASAAQGHVRYRFAFQGGFEFPLPQTGDQRMSLEAGYVTVDVCAGCGAPTPPTQAELAEALQPTAWLQSDHPRLRAIAAPIAALPVSGDRKMELLLQRARPYLGRIDFTGHYSALDTLSRRAGDCTEAAVLLAALGRAAGIPTRVANGLTYSRASYHGVSNAFMPHSWTLAWVDGAWRSFDLALGEFDSTHIALTVGDGDARSVAAAGQLAGLLRFDTMAEIRAAR